jgi:hypothetical protein
MVAGIEVVRLRRPLRSKGVDLCQVRGDAQPLALGANAARRSVRELADLAVGEAQLFSLAQGGLVERWRLRWSLSAIPSLVWMVAMLGLMSTVATPSSLRALMACVPE